MGLNQFGNIYKGKRVLITGHTGFKGSWLSLWLSELGAEVFGISLPAQTNPNHWDLLNLEIETHFLDIRYLSQLTSVINKIQPEIIFHLAAQPLVRYSYNNPAETWSTNVMGTVNVLESCRYTKSVRAVVVVTTDKCYENKEWYWGYRENDILGGYDPYSASKACCEHVVTSYRNSFFNSENRILLASARAGNVIGGGDWSVDRLIPDLVKTINTDKSLEVRSPNSTRPWQHVLESLCGYLLLGHRLLLNDASFAEAWNFGPDKEGNKKVVDVIASISTHLSNINWHESVYTHLHESKLLYLDSSKSRIRLNWVPVWDFNRTLIKTAEWYSEWINNSKVISKKQLRDYILNAKKQKASWIEQ